MAITDEFCTQVEDALCAEVLRLCGTGVEAYQDPEYLQIQTAESGLLVPQFDIRASSEFPLFVAQYSYSEPAMTQTGMGRDERLMHVWNLGVLLQLTRSNMSLTGATDQEFYREAMAAGRLLTERVRRAVNLFSPLVADTTFAGSSHKSETGRVTISRPWFQRQDADAFMVTIFYEWAIEGEIHFS